MNSIYILKTGGGDKLADFAQIRDEEFTLMEYCSVKSLPKIARKLDLHEGNFTSFVEELPYNKITEYKENVD